jgi:hypothetical protein
MAQHYHHIFVNFFATRQHGIYFATLSTYHRIRRWSSPTRAPELMCWSPITRTPFFGVYNLFVTTTVVVVYQNTRLLFESFTNIYMYQKQCYNIRLFKSKQRFGRYRRIGWLPDGRLVQMTHQWHYVYLYANLFKVATKTEQIGSVSCSEHPFGNRWHNMQVVSLK